ncbi:MAG: PAS domain-containing protein [Nocardioides sp.]|uniref:PAS domain-containing protein n=1 Tax=Nocardioides sp. TaxID=35761 RepID=UPI003F0652BB
MGPEELFFSTTDVRGVIRQGNSVFVRVSGYPLDELLGTAHNVVRHPDMPAGAFRLMWDSLAAGTPVAVYVCNRTKAGDHYWVCAVVSPLHDGFVSVRVAPTPEAVDLVSEVYVEAVRVERDAAAAGLSRREVAERGAQAIVATLATYGFSSYEEFMHVALPLEISARGHRVSEAHQRSAATGDVASVLAGTGALADQLDAMVESLATYQALGDELADAAVHVLDMAHRLEVSVHTAQQASALVAEKSPVLSNVARVMAQPMTDAVTALAQLPEDFSRLRGDIGRVRFQIALTALYDEMAAAFAAEVHDGVAPASSLTAVPLLCDAAETSVAEMAAQVEKVNGDLQHVAALVSEAGTLLDDFRRFIGQWRHLVLRHARAALAEQVRPIDEELTTSWQWTEQLRALGRQASSAVVRFDRDAAHAHLEAVREPARRLAAG